MDKCTILLENNKSELLSAQTEHGLSLLIEIENDKFLFDLGATDLFINNAKLMNIDLSCINSIILSHSHYDHCSGLLSLLKKETIKEIYVGENFFKEKYAIKDRKITYLGCGFDKKYLQKNNIKINIIKDLIKLNKSLYLVTNFKQHYKHETILKKFVHGEINQLEKDLFLDEIVLVKENKNDLTLIVGCAHRGILSIIKTVNSKFDKKVSAIIGGVHLNQADNYIIESTTKELVKLGIKNTFFCHCSGKKISEHIRENTNIEANNVATGDIILL